MYCAHAPPSPYLGLQLQNPQIHKNGMVLVSLRLAPPSALQFPVASQSSWRDDIELVILFQPPYRGVRSTGPPSGWRIRSLGPPSPVPYEQASLVVTAIGKALPVMCSPRRITLVNSFSWRLPGAGSGTWMKHLEVGLSVARHLPRDERERTVWLQYLRRSMRIGMESVPENDWVGNDTADERLDYIKFETLDDFKARVGEEKFELAFLF
ncbi:hypothetical protein CcaverHIS002_0301070 [Cutaneotrichosporon cavernicola]|nr:hypothetical protein CcaverHIS002_0301070 [Cutaneotrichosporon cavernicola]BEJ05585.1 hypothetical protein CcaverHIS641_0301070 [Cutaneotrichosporon cavernicola]